MNTFEELHDFRLFNTNLVQQFLTSFAFTSTGILM